MSKPRPRYVVCGLMDGKHFSAPGFLSHFEARFYAERKGWAEIAVIRDCEYVFGA